MVKGAKKIVVSSKNQVPETLIKIINNNKAELLIVEDAEVALAQLSAEAYNYPARKLKIVAVTGTKGKTTSAFLLNHIFTSSGFKTALISGVYNLINQEKYPANLTTPKADYVHAFFAECVNQDVEYVFMEASAHAFTLQRLYGINFVGAIFTNLDLEHLEFYKDMDEYFSAKLQILNHLSKGAPIIVNVDNFWGAKFYAQTKQALSFGFQNKNANFFISTLESKCDGLKFSLNIDKHSYVINSKLIGKFNAINIAMVASLSYKLNLSINNIVKAISSFEFVPGRMEKVLLKNGALAVIDYAHNPLSYNSVLPELKKIGKELIVVFGAGGERDASRRPLMGKAAAMWADKIILTSDNPRSEDAANIIKDIIFGIPKEFKCKIIIELDREKAIVLACQNSSKDSVIAILGKGPDNYQIIGDKKFFFSDKSVAAQN